MKSLNNVKLIGHVGQNPEMNEVSGRKVLNFSLATNYLKKDDNGKNQIITDWHRIAAWGKSAESMHQLVKKGSRLMVDGYLKNSIREDKSTQTSIVIEDFVLLSKE